MFGKFKTGNLLSRDFRASPYLYFAALLIFMRRNPEPRTPKFESGDKWLGIRDWGLGASSDW